MTDFERARRVGGNLMKIDPQLADLRENQAGRKPGCKKGFNTVLDAKLPVKRNPGFFSRVVFYH
jgi:hypothetical protein